METITIETAALTKADPGLAAVGVRVIDESGVILHQDAVGIGNATVATAHFAAVSFALEVVAGHFKNNPPKKQFVLTVTDKTVKQQLSGEHVVNDPALVPYFIQIYNLRVEYFRQLEVEYIPTKKSEAVITLVKGVLDEQS